ncbi:MAG: iron-containing alcohol dehydrogenase [Actinomycetota bacterium]
MSDFVPAFGVLRLPDSVLFGLGSRAAIAPAALGYGTRVLICCDPFLAATPEFAELLASLESRGVSVKVLTEVVPELPVESVTRAAALASDFRPEVVIGYGGGSALDLAKLVALLVVHPGPLSLYYGENAVPGPVLPLIAVPTTAGTGSEVTPVAVVSDPERELKVGVSSPHLVPRVAVVDPELSFGAPAAVTAHSGIDAFVHAVESYTAVVRPADWAEELPVFVGRNALSSLLAIEAIRLIGENLRTSVREPDNVAAREAMSYGSLLAGMAFGSAGTHLSHAMQYPIGAITKTPHGLGTGLMLPFVLQAAVDSSRPELAEIARALGVEQSSEAASAQAAVDAIAVLVADIGVPSSLADIGVSEDQLPRIAELALTVRRLAGNSTLPADEHSFARILSAAFHGDRTSIAE